MVYELAVADDIFQITYQTKFEEHHRVYALLAARTVVKFSNTIEEIQIDGIL